MTACARQPRRARRWPQRRPKRARNGRRGRPGLTAGGGKPPLARKAAISRNQPIVCRFIPVDRARPQRPACRPLTLPGEATISASLAARLSPPLAFYDIGPHDDARANRPPRTSTAMPNTPSARNAALAALREAEPVIMRSAQKGVVHSNAASRKVSRLAHRVAKLGG